MTGDDNEVMRLRDAGDDGVGHSRRLAAGNRAGFEPSRNGGGIHVEAENLVAVAGDQPGKPTSQTCSLRRRALVVQQRDSSFNFVDSDG